MQHFSMAEKPRESGKAHTFLVEMRSSHLISYVLFYLLLQVEFVIKEATNLDNLAQLYEGWTAWV